MVYLNGVRCVRRNTKDCLRPYCKFSPNRIEDFWFYFHCTNMNCFNFNYFLLPRSLPRFFELVTTNERDITSLYQFLPLFPVLNEKAVKLYSSLHTLLRERLVSSSQQLLQKQVKCNQLLLNAAYYLCYLFFILTSVFILILQLIQEMNYYVCNVLYFMMMFHVVINHKPDKSSDDGLNSFELFCLKTHFSLVLFLHETLLNTKTKQYSSLCSSHSVMLKHKLHKLRRNVMLGCWGACVYVRALRRAQETVDTGDDGDGDGEGGAGEREGPRRRRRRRQQRLPRTVVNPDENFYFYWLFVLTVCVLYNLWTLIVRQSFPELQSQASSFWLACDAFSDAVFLLDVAVQFRTGYLEQGLMVYDSKKLAGHYLRSNAFLLDLAALLPLDLLQLNFGPLPILRFPRFLKLYRVYDYYYMVESRTVYPNLWRVVNLIHILLILAHWFGCFYYLLSEAEDFQGDWVYPYRPGDYATLTRKYLGSLYWSTLTLTTIGDLPTPETNAEYVFTIVSYLIGVFIFATIVGQVGNVITNRNANRLEFERLLDGAKTYMRHHKVPGGMKRRVLRWYDYSWSRGRIQGGGDINTALGLLPDKLKTELALHVNLSVLKKVTIFQECQPEFLHDLVLKMKAYIFTPGDLICRKGEVAREMFIIADGILEVISETGRVLTTMKAGDFFGEIGILNLDGLNKRTADVRSVGYSELFSLSREDVLAAMKDYPEAQEILQSLGRKRLMEARNMSRPRGAAAATADGEDGALDAADARAGRRIVERLRSDVKGLRNALRKSRRSARHKYRFDLSSEMSEESGKRGRLLNRTVLKAVIRNIVIAQKELFKTLVKGFIAPLHFLLTLRTM
ncbi:Cyclic nucleotide-gated cation channel subunit A [Gryllus bimaculatus]|nr:Cyclic nucleotide-gated cation channel subunit A [Gryllus bimaculatus]